MSQNQDKLHFLGKPCPIIGDKDLDQFLPSSHVLAEVEHENGHRYFIRGKKGVGIFAVKRRAS